MRVLEIVNNIKKLTGGADTSVGEVGFLLSYNFKINPGVGVAISITLALVKTLKLNKDRFVFNIRFEFKNNEQIKLLIL